MIQSYKILTFGCQMNLADSGLLGSIMESRGYRPARSESEADLVILNTCSVRQKAETRVFGRLAELSALKRSERPPLIAVIGCMAQRLGERILEAAPAVDIILGTDRIFDLPDYLERERTSPIIDVAFGGEMPIEAIPARTSRWSAFVTISRGCDNYCSYCVVPYLRGPERSYPARIISRQVSALVADGALEVTLLGQNVNSYRDGDLDFPGLLKAIARETDIRRIRFMTSHPKDLSEGLIDVLATEPKMMTHVHLPLQSGSDRILGKMGRGYTFESYFSLIEKMRRAVPEVSITTDLIVGFPSETDEEYEMTLAAVRRIKYDSAFMFRYSVREGTAAARMADDVPEEVKIDRLNRLIALQKEIAHQVNRRAIGRICSVLIDGFARRGRDRLRGKTEGNKTILFPAERSVIGSIRRVKILEADSWTLFGELVA